MTHTTALRHEAARAEAERRARLLALLVWVDGTVARDGDIWTVTSNIGVARATVALAARGRGEYAVLVGGAR